MGTAFIRASILGVAVGITGCGGSAHEAADNLGSGAASVSGGTGAGQTEGSITNPLATTGGSLLATGGTAASAGGSTRSDPVPMGGTKAVGGSHSGGTVGATLAGASATGGKWATGGVAAGGTVTGGKAGTGGAALGGAATGGSAGGAATGGKPATGGAASGTVTGGKSATGGAAATGGIGNGGNSALGGTAAGGVSTTSTSTADPCTTLSNALSGGTPHCSKNQTEPYGNYEWEFWSNQPNGCLTTYSNPETFSVNWDESADALGMVGLVFDGTQTPQDLGTFSADFAETHNGTAGGYSYIGVHGWTRTPNVNFYIIDDAFDTLPFKPWNCSKFATYEIDGETYDAYYARGGESTVITEIYSVRQSNRQCGHISVSEHFSQWVKGGQTLGKLDEVRVFVEVGGGTGSIDFTMARVELK